MRDLFFPQWFGLCLRFSLFRSFFFVFFFMLVFFFFFFFFFTGAQGLESLFWVKNLI